MKMPNCISILLLSILFTVATAGSSIAAAPSSVTKFGKCTSRKGSTLHPVQDTGNGKGEKCCYPRNKTTGLKTCIKCTYPDGDSSKAICTKNQFKSVMDTPNLDSQNLPTTNAPPKPLTQRERLRRPRLNPGGAPSQLETPETPVGTPAPTRGHFRFNRSRYKGVMSRGIDQLPPAVSPDPEPPALPNFELQGKKPSER